MVMSPFWISYLRISKTAACAESGKRTPNITRKMRCFCSMLINWWWNKMPCITGLYIYSIYTSISTWRAIRKSRRLISNVIDGFFITCFAQTRSTLHQRPLKFQFLSSNFWYKFMYINHVKVTTSSNSKPTLNYHIIEMNL